jgi:proteasome accessory factor A
MARLHVIFYDNTLCQVASLLKVGVTQIILSMIEHEVINPNLLLDDPLKAVVTWSHDPFLRARAKMASGKALTAVELQLLFLEEAKRFVDSGLCSAYVPRADEILALWEDTLLKLQNADINALARRLDWVLKMTTLERVIDGHPGIGWGSPQIKHLDQIYSSLDPSEGLYWRFLQSGFVETLIDETRINWFVDNPPEDTRAWLRAMILRCASQDSVDSVDWDSVRIKTRHKGVWSRYTELEMSNPLGFSKDVCSPLLDGNLALEEMLERLTMHQDLNQDGEEEFANRAGTECLMVRGVQEGHAAK